MEEIMFQISIVAIVLGGIIFFLFWRLFSKIGSAVNKETKKIKNEIIKGEKDKDE